MSRFFERPKVKNLAIVAFVFLLGLAIGNGYQTTAAMAGQAKWLHDQCGQVLKKNVLHHIQEDRDTFGFTPEDLQSSKK